MITTLKIIKSTHEMDPPSLYIIIILCAYILNTFAYNEIKYECFLQLQVNKNHKIFGMFIQMFILPLQNDSTAHAHYNGTPGLPSRLCKPVTKERI